MRETLRVSKTDQFKTFFIMFPAALLYLTGCASTAMETHQKGVETVAEKNYVIPKRPVDRHYIGCAWSKQFGPIEDPAAADIRVKVERSFDSMQQNFAYSIGASLGAQSLPGIPSIESERGTKGAQTGKGEPSTKGGQSQTGGQNTKEGTSAKSEQSTKGGQSEKAGQGAKDEKGAKDAQGKKIEVAIKQPTAEAGFEGGARRSSELQNVQIISPVSLADIPFEMNIPYITEALRLGNFRMKSESAAAAGVSGEAGSVKGGVKGMVENGAGTAGEGLVVAYKLQMIDPKTYSKQDYGSAPLELNKTIEFPQANLLVRSQLSVIEAGANKSLPRGLLWACDRAEAVSKDIVAAWVIDIRSRDPRKKSLQIAFPAFPRIDDCQNFSGLLYAGIDPRTDKIFREKITITLVDEDLSDSLKPRRWEARMSLVDESFNIKLVREGDLSK